MELKASVYVEELRTTSVGSYFLTNFITFFPKERGTEVIIIVLFLVLGPYPIVLRAYA